MTKEQARHTLEIYLTSLVNVNTETITLPIVDAVISSTIVVSIGSIEQWTFKGLLKIAYDL